MNCVASPKSHKYCVMVPLEVSVKFMGTPIQVLSLGILLKPALKTFPKIIVVVTESLHDPFDTISFTSTVGVATGKVCATDWPVSTLPSLKYHVQELMPLPPG